MSMINFILSVISAGVCAMNYATGEHGNGNLDGISGYCQFDVGDERRVTK